MAKFKISLQGKELDAEVTKQGDRLHVLVEGITAEFHLLQQDPPSYIVEFNKPDGNLKRLRIAGHMMGDQRQLWVNGRSLSYKRVRERGSRNVVDGSLSASIPAIVSQVLVSPGEKVSAGDRLILLESMKMVIPILAPCDCLVKAIHCAVGESVQAGVPLIELEEVQI